VLGSAKIALQNPLQRPKRPKRSPRPKCHASTLELWKATVTAYRRFVVAFKQASSQWRSGVSLQVAFPANCFVPAP
jgi:hypothetical protein